MNESDLIHLFYPQMAERLTFFENGGRLSHYTSAESGFKILRSQEVWLRNSLLMNDFSEIEHGLACLNAAWSSPYGEIFQTWLDNKFPGVKDQIVETFAGHSSGFKSATFIMSLSEHIDEEDHYGRLSMWRAYGGKNSVCLVMNSRIFNSETDELKVYSSPVMYKSVADFVTWFENWSNTIMASEEELLKQDPKLIAGYIFSAFRNAALCTKHPGFCEEKEWRVFHSPLIEGTSEWIRKDHEIIGGVPQEIIKLVLRDDAEKQVLGLSPESLLNRVIIGPSEHPLPLYHAFYNILAERGFDEPAGRLFISQIPLRH